FLKHVGAHQFRIALERIAPAAAASGAHDGLRGDRHRDVRADHRLELVLAWHAQQVAAAFASLAAPQPPRRAVAASFVLDMPPAYDQLAEVHGDAGPAAVFAGAAGIAAQRAALHQHRAFELDALDRAVAHVALADRDGRGLAILERPAAPAAAFDALHHEA